MRRLCFVSFFLYALFTHADISNAQTPLPIDGGQFETLEQLKLNKLGALEGQLGSQGWLVRPQDGDLDLPWSEWDLESGESLQEYIRKKTDLVLHPANPGAIEGGIADRGPLPASFQTPAFATYKAECTPWVNRMRTVMKDRYSSRKSMLEVIRPYYSNCMRKVSEVPTELKAKIFAIVGVLYDRSRNEIFCAGTRISDTRVVTARHCMFLGGQSGTGDRDPNNIVFYSLDVPNRPMSVSVARSASQDWKASFDQTNNRDDWIVLQTQRFPLALAPSVGSVASQNQSVMVLGPAIGLIRLDEVVNPALLSADQLQNGGWVDYMRFDSSASCLALTTRQGFCSFHGCQTAGMMSGAGVLQLVNGGIRLLGIHLGSPDSTGTVDQTKTCTCKSLEAEPNVARSFNNKLTALVTQ